jgi:hypothetical protein
MTIGGDGRAGTPRMGPVTFGRNCTNCDTSDGALVPWAFLANTRNSYVPAGCSERIVQLVAVDSRFSIGYQFGSPI